MRTVRPSTSPMIVSPNRSPISRGPATPSVPPSSGRTVGNSTRAVSSAKARRRRGGTVCSPIPGISMISVPMRAKVIR